MMRRALRWMDERSWRWPLLLLLAGAAWRLAYLLASPGGLGHAEGEAFNVAASLARTGQAADVFGRGSGLTTHFTPSMQLITGFIYAAFGIKSAASELILASLAIALVLTGPFYLYRAFGLMGLSNLFRRYALGFICLLPLHPRMEIIDFRAWEGGLATALGSICFYLIIKAEQAKKLSTRALIGLGLLTALVFYISPPLGLGLYACAGLWTLRNAKVRDWAKMIGIASICLAAILTPWTIRNYVSFGEFIPMRSNFGLELALSNHEKAVRNTDQRSTYVERLRQIHPLESETAFAAMKATGNERAYAASLGAAANQWIADNPGSFVKLCARHVAEFFFPPRWIWHVYGGPTSAKTKLFQAIAWTLSIGALLAVAFSVLFWRGPWLFAAAYLVLPVLPYALVQPVARYRYLIFALSVFLAARVIQLGWTQFSRRSIDLSGR